MLECVVEKKVSKKSPYFQGEPTNKENLDFHKTNYADKILSLSHSPLPLFIEPSKVSKH